HRARRPLDVPGGPLRLLGRPGFVDQPGGQGREHEEEEGHARRLAERRSAARGARLTQRESGHDVSSPGSPKALRRFDLHFPPGTTMERKAALGWTLPRFRRHIGPWLRVSMRT